MDSDAIPPSSPPLMGMATLSSSPFFNAQADAFSQKSSSPPPLFSSDDSRESIDVSNYESPRIYKNKRKGTWWDNRESAHNTPEPKKTKITRNFDSGVYMMSDATDNSEDMLPQHKLPFSFDGACDEGRSTRPAETAFISQLRAGLEKDHEVYEFRCLDLEDSDIGRIGDLASIIRNPPDAGLDRPAEGQYRSFVPEIYINLGLNRLCRLTPSLFNVEALTALVLRNNQIKNIPPHISQLRYLKTLDVSLNNLVTLPFEMVHLLQPHGSLERLNVMGNPLLEPMSFARFNSGYSSTNLSSVFLADSLDPYLKLHPDNASKALLDLYRCWDTCPDREQIAWRTRSIESWTNAFSGNKCDDAETELAIDEGLYNHHPALVLEDASSRTPRYIARTLVSFFDQAGHVIQGSPITPESDDQDYPLIVETNHGTYGAPSSPWFTPPSSSKVASLLTTSLQNAFEKRHNGEYSVEDVRNMLPGPIPRDANAIFEQAIENDAGGYGEFRQCHLCGKKYVVSRAEWIEFWSVGFGVFYPMEVKVCSWGCVPEQMLKKPERERA